MGNLFQKMSIAFVFEKITDFFSFFLILGVDTDGSKVWTKRGKKKKRI